MSLKGGQELRARLRAIREVFKPIGRDWADETARIARGKVPVKTGRLQKSIRRRNATLKKATVVAHHSAFFIDKGTRAHEIRPKRANTLRFEGSRGIVFAKRVKHPRVAPRPFRQQAAEEALRKNPMANNVIEAWNRARAGW